MASIVDLSVLAESISGKFGNVSSVQHEQTPVTDQMHLGSVTRLTVDYDEPIEGSRTFVLKKNVQHGPTNAMAKSFRLYEREVNFYKTIAQHVKAAIPTCYHASLEDDGAAFTLLLEDLAPLTVGDTHRSLTCSQAVAAVKVLAQFHASFWGNQQLLDSFELMKPSDSRGMMEGAMQPAVVDFVLSLWADEIPDPVKDKIRSSAQRLDSWIAALEDGEGLHTLIHGDTRQNNWMYSEPQQDAQTGVETVERCVLLDFQSYTQGGLLACADDLSFLLVGGVETSLLTEQRAVFLQEYVTAFNEVADTKIDEQSISQLFVQAAEGLIVRVLLFHMMMMRRLPAEGIKTQLGTFVRRAIAAIALYGL